MWLRQGIGAACYQAFFDRRQDSGQRGYVEAWEDQGNESSEVVCPNRAWG